MWNSDATILYFTSKTTVNCQQTALKVKGLKLSWHACILECIQLCSGVRQQRGACRMPVNRAGGAARVLVPWQKLSQGDRNPLLIWLQCILPSEELT